MILDIDRERWRKKQNCIPEDFKIVNPLGGLIQFNWKLLINEKKMKGYFNKINFSRIIYIKQKKSNKKSYNVWFYLYSFPFDL